jgi:type II secretory pathway pseudopilin PulG
MATALGLIGLLVVIVCVIALAAAVTWLVVKISPTTVGKKPAAKSGDN